MTSPLHKGPVGLLELFKLKTLGHSPNSFGAQVVPTVDVREFYASRQLVVTSGAPTVGALANLLETVSLTDALGLKAISVNLVIGAAAATNLTISWGISIEGAEMCVGSQFIAGTAAAQQVFCGCPIPGWVLPAGSLIIARASGTAAGADHSLDVHALIENYVSGG